MTPPSARSNNILWPYFFITYLVLLLNEAGNLRTVKYIGTVTPFFTIAVYLSYCFIYLFPLVVILLLLNRILFLDVLLRWSKNMARFNTWFIYGLAVIGCTLLQLVIYADKIIFRLYGFHLNGFVWNLVCTPGGLESLEGGRVTAITYGLIFAGFFLLQTLMLILVLSIKRIQTAWSSIATRPAMIAFAVVLLILNVFQSITYGYSNLQGYTPVLAAAKAFPLYQGISFKHMAKSLGFEVTRDHAFRMKAGENLRLHYPLQAIDRDVQHKPYNIVWLVAESLRADMVDPEIMPATWRFSQKAACFKNHYSGGNGTRMGMFSMFYGLYGNYWFAFLDERRGPLVMDLLLKDNYQMDMFTSARFTYPEFDKTIFSQIPKEHLHEADGGYGWQRDRENVSGLLNCIDGRDPSRPFMTFMFFESPHARYFFPPETSIRTPFLEELNYATMDLEHDMPLIRNRYVNACNHLDTQIRRIVEYLDEHALLDSTIVLITGDHGEEFMEKGHWGHGSAFTKEQVHVPLILWIPGKAHREITALTSHLDIPATLLTVLGVKNKPEDYSLGFDLFGTPQRKFTVASDWNSLVYMDQDYTAIFPFNTYGFNRQTLTTADGLEVTDRDAFYKTCKPRLLTIMAELEKFSEH